MVPQVGQRIGPYEILGRLGSGGMGLVFSAWDARLQRDVAIKLLREEYATPEMRSRFLQEARAASGLNHPNICTIFDIGEQEGDPYLVMELLKGETLRSRINHGNISPREILRVAHEIADALTVAHARGVIHRDIKPANIILVNKAGGSFGTKVLDFGLAKIDTGYGADSLLDLTNTGTTVGTVSYMSPEQARGEGLDFRSDLFSLGVMLYEMATGRLPFQGATSALVFVQLLSHPPDPIRPQNPQITEDLEHLILRLLEKDRSVRFQSAAQVMEAVDLIPFVGSSPSRPSYAAVPIPATPSAERRAVANPVPVERRNSARVFPRSPGSEPPTLPVRRSGASTPSLPVAKPTAPEADSKTTRAAMSGDEFLRPVRRIATPASESSAYNLRAARESSGILPAAPVTPVPAQVASPVAPTPPTLAPPAAASSASNTPAAPRDITTQSVRPITTQTEIPQMNLPRITSVRPSPKVSVKTESSRAEVAAAAVGVSNRVSERESEPSEPKPRMWLLFVGLGVMAVVGVIGWLFLWPHSSTPASARTISIVIAHVEDMTGGGLSNSVASGLEFDLAQSPMLIVQVPSSLRSGMRALGDDDTDVISLENSRKAARPIGVAEILNGQVRISGNSYIVSFRINSVATGGEVLTAEETAQSRQQIPDAIDRLAIDLRNGLGESSDSISKNSVALSKEATSNLDALQAYSLGTGFLSIGSLDEAETAFQRALVDDPHFTQPYLRLAEIYRQERAFVASANEAAFAQNTAQSASGRTQLLSQASYALNGPGDLTAVVGLMQQLTNTFRDAVTAHVQAATALRLQGKFSESLEAAQSVLRLSPLNNGALVAAEMAMIATDRTEAAVPLEISAVRDGRPHPELKLLIDYLNSGEQGPIDTSGEPTGHLSLGVVQAQLLDATGAAGAGLNVWGELAASSANHPQLVSAASDLLSAAALNRALTGDCTSSSMLLQRAAVFPSAADTIFRSGLAYALCGNLDAARDSSGLLAKNYPTSFAAKGYYVPEINAVIQWKSGDAHGGLETLAASKQYDLISFTPYLRGLMHIADKQAQVAVSDFNFVLQHKGAMAIMDPLVIPLAQAGLGRAYLASGDHANSAAAYARFLTMWKSGDGNQLLLSEARANSR